MAHAHRASASASWPFSVSPVHNIKGILLGEALTAARDVAQPLATKEALAAWASEQANIISNCTDDDEYKARAAEVVLECGGTVGNLKIVKWGADWLNEGEFEERLRLSSEIAISFDGGFSFEDYNSAHPVDFDNNNYLRTLRMFFAMTEACSGQILPPQEPQSLFQLELIGLKCQHTSKI